MIEISFREVFEYQYHEDGFHELYVTKNGLNETLYIGISSDNIWNRWFGARGHIMVGPNYLMAGADHDTKTSAEPECDLQLESRH